MEDNPIVLERVFCRLQASIAYGGSNLQVRQVANFLRSLDRLHVDAEGYLIQLSAEIKGIVERLYPSGLDPRDVEIIYRAIAKYETSTGPLCRLAEIRNALRRLLVLHFAFVGDINAVVRYAEPPIGDIGFVAKMHRDGSPLERFEQFAKHREKIDRATNGDLEWATTQWHRQLAPDYRGVLVPVIETPPEGESVVAAKLVRLEVVIEEAVDTRAELRIDFPVEHSLRETLRSIPVRAAERLLERRHTHRRNRGLRARLRWNEEESVLRGKSAMLAVAALYYCEADHFMDRRVTYRLKDDVAITGSVDEFGTVCAVDNSTLEAKVSAAFFSWVEVLAVPTEQVSRALSVVEIHRKAFPDGRLKIVGVSDFEDILTNRRIVERMEHTLTQHLLRKAWRGRGLIFATVVTGIILISIVRFWYGPIDRNPVAADFEGRYLVVKNPMGEVLKKIPVGSTTAEIADNRWPNYVTFADANSDGNNEVFWSDIRVNEKGGVSYINAEAIDDDTFGWQKELLFPVEFPRKPDIVEGSFEAHDLISGDFDGDGSNEIIALLKHDHFFPHLVIRYDASSGREMGRYLHVGLLSGLNTVDLDRDGIEEILAVGVNNAFNQGILTVLDPTSLDGHSPLDGDYEVKGYARAKERAYLRIPRTIVGDAVRQYSPMNPITNVEIRRKSGRVILRIYDVNFSGKPPFLVPERSYIYVYLDFNLHPVGVGTSSTFDGTALKFQREGLIDQVPRYDYFQKYQESFLYLDGNDWYQEPRWNSAAEYVEP